MRWKIVYEFGGSRHIGDVISLNLIAHTAVVINTSNNQQFRLELSYLKNKMLETSEYFDQIGNELFEYDIVEVPGFWKGIVKKHKNVFVIELLNNKQAFINMHEMYSEINKDGFVIPSIVRYGTSIDLDL